MRSATIGLACAIGLVCAVSAGAQTPDRPAPSRAALVEVARSIIEASRYCAVITVDSSGRPQARTIDAFAPDEAMVVWFATNPKSRKVAEIKRDPRVTLYYFDPKSMGYVSLVGHARLVDDPVEKQKRWKAGWEAFWPDRDKSFLLVEVTPERLELVSSQHAIEGDPVTWEPRIVSFPQ